MTTPTILRAESVNPTMAVQARSSHLQDLPLLSRCKSQALYTHTVPRRCVIVVHLHIRLGAIEKHPSHQTGGFLELKRPRSNSNRPGENVVAHSRVSALFQPLFAQTTCLAFMPGTKRGRLDSDTCDFGWPEIRRGLIHKKSPPPVFHHHRGSCLS